MDLSIYATQIPFNYIIISMLPAKLRGKLRMIMPRPKQPAHQQFFPPFYSA